VAAAEGSPRRALDEASLGVAEAARLDHWWLDNLVGELHLVASEATARLGQSAAALAHARAAVVHYQRNTDRNEIPGNRRGLGRALARVDALRDRP
jgi:hypothetical protein